ncbi:MAG TPA: hypothetical protein VGC16_10740 [Rhizomicrobium sp.]
MFRVFTTAAILALTAATAQADDGLAARIHEAAVTACAAESSSSLPVSHYGAITQYCIARVSNTTLARIQANALAKTRASTAALVNN